jgi:hypothetical protein
VFRIRIRIGSGFNQVCGFGSRRTKITLKNVKKLRMSNYTRCHASVTVFPVLITWISFLPDYIFLPYNSGARESRLIDRLAAFSCKGSCKFYYKSMTKYFGTCIVPYRIGLSFFSFLFFFSMERMTRVSLVFFSQTLKRRPAGKSLSQLR